METLVVPSHGATPQELFLESHIELAGSRRAGRSSPGMYDRFHAERRTLISVGDTRREAAAPEAGSGQMGHPKGGDGP